MIKQLFQKKCSILSIKRLALRIFSHEYECPEVASCARPGQFLQIRIEENFSLLLPRPFSIFNTNEKMGTVSIIFKVIGTGTELLAKKNIGDTVWIFGPLGNSFRTDTYKSHLLVAGGIGLPPLYFLLKRNIPTDFKAQLFFGTATKDELFVMDELNAFSIPIVYTTEDGSFGKKGLVTEPFEDELKRYAQRTDVSIYACGPLPMLSEVQKLALKYGIPAQISVETMMACGFGLCQGCVMPAKKSGGDVINYHLVCTEGPIFNAGDLEL